MSYTFSLYLTSQIKKFDRNVQSYLKIIRDSLQLRTQFQSRSKKHPVFNPIFPGLVTTAGDFRHRRMLVQAFNSRRLPFRQSFRVQIKFCCPVHSRTIGDRMRSVGVRDSYRFASKLWPFSQANGNEETVHVYVHDHLVLQKFRGITICHRSNSMFQSSS